MLAAGCKTVSGLDMPRSGGRFHSGASDQVIEMTGMSLRTSALLRAASLLPLMLLTACAGSQRFGGYGSGPTVARAPVYSEPVQSAPPIQSAPVTAEPLPPPGGYPSAPPQAGGYPAGGPAPGAGGMPPQNDPYYDPQAAQPGQQPTAPRPLDPAPPSNQVASANPGARPGGGSTRSGAVSSRDGVIGNWTAQEATGGSCRVQLSSSPSLDLYRASANGCSNRDLQQVNAWDYRDGEVYLYQRGGSVVARLRVGSAGSMNGAITKSGAGLSMNR
jgi:hypothetical protein